MATDYGALLNNYIKTNGWDSVSSALDAGRSTNEHRDGYAETTLPGIGKISRDPNGTVMFLDPDSRDAYAKTGNAPVYNYVLGPDGASKYQVSHGGMSAEKLAMLTAAALTAGIGTGYIPGLESAATTAGGLDVTGLGLEQFASELPELSSLGVTEAGGLAYPGMEGYLAPAALDAGALDVSNLGLDQYTSELPDVSKLGTTAEGGLAYPGMDGYIPPAGSSSLANTLKSAVTPSNVAKLASALISGAGKSGGGGIGGMGSGFSGAPNEISNMTPGMMQIAAAPQQQSQSTPAMQIGDYKQPTFAGGQYFAIPEGVKQQPLEDDSQIARLAKMLQEGSWQT